MTDTFRPAQTGQYHLSHRPIRNHKDSQAIVLFSFGQSRKFFSNGEPSRQTSVWLPFSLPGTLPGWMNFSWTLLGHLSLYLRSRR